MFGMDEGDNTTKVMLVESGDKTYRFRIDRYVVGDGLELYLEGKRVAWFTSWRAFMFEDALLSKDEVEQEAVA